MYKPKDFFTKIHRYLEERAFNNYFKEKRTIKQQWVTVEWLFQAAMLLLGITYFIVELCGILGK
jgi:hypothetical protein